ncbi:MAG: hypothetical protein NT068_01765 [Candidatus Nomurabacteria bacterium]|nr:hypothetical protein [Candidatus Nomurabacteria bacterium]
MDHLKELILFFIVLWFVWYLLIGPNKDSNKPFLNPPAPISTGGAYGPTN